MDDSFAAFEVGAQAQHAAPVVRACTRFVSCSCCNSFSSSVIGHWWPRFILFLLSFILASRWTRLMYLGDVLLFSFVIPPASMHRGCAIQRCALRCSVFEACFNARARGRCSAGAGPDTAAAVTPSSGNTTAAAGPISVRHAVMSVQWRPKKSLRWAVAIGGYTRTTTNIPTSHASAAATDTTTVDGRSPT